MRKSANNERELQEIESEIRKLGNPYASEEPDARYWANFRVRVMERVREEETRKVVNWPALTINWIQEHLLATSLSTAAVLVALWGVLMMQPLNPVQSVKQEVALQTPAPVAQPAPAPIPEPAKPATEPAKPAHHDLASRITHKHVESMPELAAVDLPVSSATDAIGPVGLEDLSTTELQTVLDNLEHE